MSDRGFVPHVENNVRMRGAPGMDFGMENARGLRNLANGLNDLGDGILSAGGAMREFVERKADTQNKLMATQADNLYLAIQEELNNRMAANPASYKDFPKWADEADQRYLDESRQYTEQMTTDFRELYYARKEHDRIQDLSKRQMIATQAEVTNQYNMMQTQLKSAAEQGRADNYKEILEAHRGVLISEDEYNLRMSEYGKLADSAAAKRMVDAAADSDSSVQAKAALEQLKERDSDGNFVNFKNLTEDYRDQLIRAAKTAQNKAELDMDQAFLSRFYQGDTPTEDEVKQKHDDGTISNEQFNKWMSWVKQFHTNAENEATRSRNKKIKEETEDFEARLSGGYEVPYRSVAELKAALEQGTIDSEQFNKYFAILSRREQALEQAAEKARRAEEQHSVDILNSWKYKIYTEDFSPNPENAIEKAKGFWDSIQKQIKNPKQLLDLNEYLQKKVQDTISQKEDEFQTPDGKDVLNFIESSYWEDEGYKGLAYDVGWFWDGDNSQEHQRAQFYSILEIAREKLRKGEPSNQIKEYIKERVGAMNKGKIRNVMDSMYNSIPTGHTPEMWNSLSLGFPMP